MKAQTKLLLLVLLSLSFNSCKKDLNTDTTPKPAVSLVFGYYPTSGASQVINFANQDSVYLKNYKNIATCILEDNFLQDKDLELTLKVITKSDSEIFVSNKNVHISFGALVRNSSFEIIRIENDFEIPIKITDRVIPLNDTIEFNSQKDIINVHYKSCYSSLEIRKTIKIWRIE